MLGDTGTALAAAILANPDDDAPWLVYADWLQEAGRDAEAMAIRSHLPALRDAIWNGHDLSFVLTLATSHPPGDPVWNAAFGLPLNLPDPEPVPIAPPRQPVWTTAPERDGPSWGPAVFPILYFVFVLIRAIATSPDRQRTEPSVEQSRQQIQRIVDKSPAARDFRPAPPDPPTQLWGRAGTTGSNFQPARPEVESKPTACPPDRTMPASSGWNGPVRWTIQPDGWITLTSGDGSKSSRIFQVPVASGTKPAEREGTTDLNIRPKQ